MILTLIPFKKLNIVDSTLQRVQDNVAQVFDGLATSFLLNAVLNNGNLSQGITFVSGVDNYVSHGLGRVPLGYFVTTKNTPVDIYTSSTVNPDPSKVIVLKSNANAIVNIVFF